MRSWTSFAGAVLGRIGRVIELLKAELTLVAARDSGESTPLHLAAWNGKKEMAELLRAHGADINAQNRRNETPVSLAAISEHEDVVEYLITSGAKLDIFTAVKLDKVDQIAACLKETPDLINAKNRYGRTPLCLARGDTVEFLLKNGAELNIWTAAKLGQRDEIAAFLDADAALVNAEQGGLLPLRHAVLAGHRDVVELLLEHGAFGARGMGQRLQKAANLWSLDIRHSRRTVYSKGCETVSAANPRGSGRGFATRERLRN